MEFTILFSKVVGPLLIVRAASIVFDRRHFADMLDGVEREVNTLAFSFFPIALFLTTAAITVTYNDYSSAAAWMIHLVAWGGLLKATALMLFPRIVAAKARLLGQHGFLNIVLAACLAGGGYLTWFGYFADRAT